MGMFDRAMAGAGEGLAQVGGMYLNDKLQERREARLAATKRQANKDAMADEAEFKDARYEKDRDRRLGEREEELKLSKKYATPKKDSGDRWVQVTLSEEEDEFGNTVKVQGVMNQRNGQTLDMKGNEIIPAYGSSKAKPDLVDPREATFRERFKKEHPNPTKEQQAEFELNLLRKLKANTVDPAPKKAKPETAPASAPKGGSPLRPWERDRRESPVPPRRPWEETGVYVPPKFDDGF